MNVKTRILGGLLGIIALICWVTIYGAWYVDFLLLQGMTETPLLAMFNITVVCWLVFVVFAFMGKGRVMTVVSSGAVLLGIATACVVLYAENKLSNNLSGLMSAALDSPMDKYNVSFESVKIFIPVLILGIICLVISMKFGKKPIIEKEA